MEEKVILINPNDEITGIADKQEAHEKALLHRAFSVFLFNKNGDMLLQKRSAKKYHSSGKWANACCSHPRNGESYTDAALRRMKEELGITTNITKKFHFIYKAYVGDGMWEHELDHVFTGIYDGDFKLNTDEVSEVKYTKITHLETDIKENPDHYTEWFKIIWKKYRQSL